MSALQGKVALITGAGKGIGRAIAECFAQNGAAVAVVDIDGPAARDTAGLIASRGQRALAIEADVTRQEHIDRAFRDCIGTLRGLDLLVNNVGVTARAEFVDLTEQDWEKVMSTNLKSYLFCSQVAVRYWLREKRRGKIINIGSIDDQVLVPRHLLYCISKAGVAMLTRWLAKYLAPYKINVNAVGPGIIEGGLIQKYLHDPAHAERLRNSQPWGRMGRLEEVAQAALYLASDAADFATGTILYIDGGRLLQPVEPL